MFLFFHIGDNHRASNAEILKLFFEQFSELSTVEFLSIIFRPVENDGCLGVGRGACSLLIIEITSDMVGR
jgi:hypothetical protein